MDTTFRDDAISKYRLALRITFIWAFVSTFTVLILSVVNLYSFKHQKTHWLPVCSSTDFWVGESDYSPAYLKEMVKKITDLRLTYNPETIDSRYKRLINLTPAPYQEALTKQLMNEIKAVKKKNISSVFYSDKIFVDTKNHMAVISGHLHRTSHGLSVKPAYKSYQVKFHFKSGDLSPISITEVSHEKA